MFLDKNGAQKTFIVWQLGLLSTEIVVRSLLRIQAIQSLKIVTFSYAIRLMVQSEVDRSTWYV